ncbi:MAG: type II/IV secretion system protein [Dehalococcoidia bacterium]|nr:type II/IV secretion system protein [Dehalococcoidia bacterium]
MRISEDVNHEEAGTDKLLVKFLERLEALGYVVEKEASLEGKSGASHLFDLLAHKYDGLINYTVAVAFIHVEGEVVGLEDVFNFDSKCYDCGILDKIIVSSQRLDSIAANFAQRQKMTVFYSGELEALLEEPLPARQVEKGVFKAFSTKQEFIDALQNSGYRTEERARLTGASGTEYTFDILAECDEVFLIHRVGVKVTSGGEVNLDEVSLFDTRAYDAGIRHKVILLSGRFTSEARQFVERRGMVIVELKAEGAFSAEEETSDIQAVVEEILTAVPESKKERLLKQQVEPEIMQLIPEVMARRFKSMPLRVEDNVLHVAMANPSDIFALEALGLQSRMRIEPVVAGEREIMEAIDFNYKGFGHLEEQISQMPMAEEEEDTDLVEATSNAPVASALRLIVDEALVSRASDIHIEPQENRLRVRYRVDGALREVMSLPLKIHPVLTSRIKIMSDMNIADHLRPQDGQFSTESKGRLIDVRVATAPTVYGETTVLRLLDKSLAVMDLPQLGFSPGALEKAEKMLRVPFGMILVSGPTGAGKTTTLYAAVNQLDKTSRNIITIEDPVEYRFSSINQMQVNPKAGFTFASGLRSILRLDPDVVLVGEIRDAETAGIAIQAALTGHLVLSSIHANDAVGVIYRLLDLGVEPFLVSSALIGVVAQRMVRRVCPDCHVNKTDVPLMERQAYTAEMGEKKTRFLYGKGCEMCSHTGYRGRTGIFEVLALSDSIRMQILRNASTAEVRKQAIDEGMVPLLKDGMLKVKEGVTTPSEVLRNAYFIE